MTKFSILLVDDDLINRKLIKAMLAHHKDIVDNIIEATNGAQALELIECNDSINLVLLDIFMPILDGKGFLKAFRSKKNNANTPVIVLTTDDSIVSEVINYGADDVMVKPIKEEELLHKINYWIDNKEQ